MIGIHIFYWCLALLLPSIAFGTDDNCDASGTAETSQDLTGLLQGRLHVEHVEATETEAANEFFEFLHDGFCDTKHLLSESSVGSLRALTDCALECKGDQRCGYFSVSHVFHKPENDCALFDASGGCPRANGMGKGVYNSYKMMAPTEGLRNRDKTTSKGYHLIGRGYCRSSSCADRESCVSDFSKSVTVCKLNLDECKAKCDIYPKCKAIAWSESGSTGCDGRPACIVYGVQEAVTTNTFPEHVQEFTCYGKSGSLVRGTSTATATAAPTVTRNPGISGPDVGPPDDEEEKDDDDSDGTVTSEEVLSEAFHSLADDKRFLSMVMAKLKAASVRDSGDFSGEAPEPATEKGEAPEPATEKGEAPEPATEKGEVPEPATGGEAPEPATEKGRVTTGPSGKHSPNEESDDKDASPKSEDFFVEPDKDSDSQSPAPSPSSVTTHHGSGHAPIIDKDGYVVHDDEDTPFPSPSPSPTPVKFSPA